VGLVELFMEEYVLAIVMPTKKNIFGNWIEFHMCGGLFFSEQIDFFGQICHANTKTIFDALDRFVVPWTCGLSTINYH
jgi:hypothetical protein